MEREMSKIGQFFKNIKTISKNSRGSYISTLIYRDNDNDTATAYFIGNNDGQINESYASLKGITGQEFENIYCRKRYYLKLTGLNIEDLEIIAKMYAVRYSATNIFEGSIVGYRHYMNSFFERLMESEYFAEFFMHFQQGLLSEIEHAEIRKFIDNRLLRIEDPLVRDECYKLDIQTCYDMVVQSINEPQLVKSLIN